MVWHAAAGHRHDARFCLGVGVTMKIGFLIPCTFALGNPKNGVREQALYQAQALREAGHDVILMDGWCAYDLNTFDVVQFFTGGFVTFGIETLDRGRAILVWAPMIDSNTSFRQYRMAARMGRVHSRIFTLPGMMQEQAQGCDLVVARSTHERDRVIQGLGIDPGKVKIVLNGANPTATVGDLNRAEQITGHKPGSFAMHLSAYTQPRKNVVNLVRAVGPTGRPLVVVGVAEEGKVLQELRRLTTQYPNVKLLGRLTDEDRNVLFAACKVFCLPSVHEGTGLAALEAAVHGAAIVITQNGGPPDYFGSLAHYVDPDSVESIRNAVEAAFAAPASDALREHIASKLTWKQSAQSLVDAYSHALANRSVHRA